MKYLLGGDGFLGATFFSNRIWKFNYPLQQLSYCKKIDSLDHFAMMPVFFKSSTGIRNTGQPRMEMKVLGQKIPMLFDTGATSLYSSKATKLINKKGPVSSSFIRESVAKKWKENHPEWRFIKKGDKINGGMDMIEVPKVYIAGINVGPIWFAVRLDKTYDKNSHDMMDSNIDGALGGNAFKSLQIIADYPNAKFYFQKP